LVIAGIATYFIPFAAAQLKEYVPFTFQPATPVYYFYQSVASDFMDYVKRYEKYLTLD
jgi:hypothetical protein